MATKFWRITLRGEKPLAEVEATVGESGGIPLRIHFEGGETRVYFEAEEPVVANVMKAFAGTAKPVAGAAKPVQVSAKELTDIG